MVNWTSGDVVNVQATLRRMVSSIPSSYTVAPIGSTYYAESNTAGGTDYEGADATTVINQALAALTGGRTWKEKVVLKGDFEIDDSILAPSYSVIEIQGRLKAADGASISSAMAVIQNSNRALDTANNDITIIGGEIDGNKTNNATSFEGVAMGHTKNFVLADMLVHDAKEIGIVTGSKATIEHWGTVLNCHSHSNTNEGFQFDGTGIIRVIGGAYYNNGTAGIHKTHGSAVAADRMGLTIEGTFAYSNTSHGISVVKQSAVVPENISITGCQSFENGGDGIVVSECRGVTLAENVCWKNEFCGMRLWNPVDFSCQGNILKNNDQDGGVDPTNYRAGLLLNYPRGGTVTGNVCTDDQVAPTQDRGLILQGSGADIPDATVIMGNNVVGNVSFDFLLQVATGVTNSVLIKNNVGANPLGLAVGGNPFDTTNDYIEINGDAAAPAASTVYTVQETDVMISSTDSANNDNAILIKDADGVQITPNALSTLDARILPHNYQIDWGAWTVGAPTVVVSFI